MADLTWKGTEIADNIDDAIKDALQAGAELLKDEAVERTPVETATLRGTAKPSYDDGEAVVSYDTKYARRQHEEIGWQHPGGGQAKFLESALIDNQDKIRDVIAEELRKGLS